MYLFIHTTETIFEVKSIAALICIPPGKARVTYCIIQLKTANERAKLRIILGVMCITSHIRRHVSIPLFLSLFSTILAISARALYYNVITRKLVYYGEQ
jgi:hypothetical protein